MLGQTIAIGLNLVTDSPEDLERFGLDLQHDLEYLPNATVSAATTVAPQGTKSAGGLDWTQLVLTLAASGGVITTLIGLIQSRLTRERKVRMVVDGDELEVSGLGPDQEKAIIDAWVARQRAKLNRA